MSHAHAPAAPRASTSLIHPPDTELVLHAEHALAQAHITLDLATIDQLLHPDYLIVQPGGTLGNQGRGAGVVPNWNAAVGERSS